MAQSKNPLVVALNTMSVVAASRYNNSGCGGISFDDKNGLGSRRTTTSTNLKLYL
jgi:hypothetical protein